ncbi:MAG: hypothetical protein ABIA21_03105 [Candidatus Aenigmatarchaeota archaeon]
MGYLQDLGREREGRITKIERIGSDPVKVSCSKRLFCIFDHVSHWLNAYQEFHEALYGPGYELEYIRFTPWQMPSDEVISRLYRFDRFRSTPPVKSLKEDTKKIGLWRVFVTNKDTYVPSRRFLVNQQNRKLVFDREIWRIGLMNDDQKLFNAEVDGFLDIIRGAGSPEESIEHVKNSFIYPRIIYEI